MRGQDSRSGSLFSYVDLEQRVRSDHPLRTIRTLVNEALASLDGRFGEIYSEIGRPSIPPEQLLRAMLLQAFYSVRSERQLMEQLDFNLLFRWFVGLGVDDPVWDASTFSKNRDRLLDGSVAAAFLRAHLTTLTERGTYDSSHACGQTKAVPGIKALPRRRNVIGATSPMRSGLRSSPSCQSRPVLAVRDGSICGKS